MKRNIGPKCKCGCGEIVKMGRFEWNKYLPGHNLKFPLNPQKEKERREKISKTMKERLALYPEEIEKRREIWTGRNHSEETKKKLSKIMKGEKNGMFGKTHSEEVKKKISNYWKGRVFSKETLEKISKANSGKIRTEELKAILSQKLKEYYKTHDNYFKGKHHTEETKNKISNANKKYCGELASNWRGGIGSFPYNIEWTRYLRETIKERDNHKCRNPKCLKISKILDIHHIDYDKENSNPNNLITICKSCHGKTQFNRRQWKRYYQSIMKKIMEDK